MKRKNKTPDAAPPAAPIPAPPGPAPDGARGRKAARVFLMVAGGLAAPCLALAAFFLTNSGGSDTPAKAAVTQPGHVGTSAPGSVTRPSGSAASAATTTTTTVSGPVATPPRDPFAPLVSAGAAGPPGK